MKWLKQWLREKLLDTEEDVRYIQAEKISRGSTAEQRLDFWRGMKDWYTTPNGKAFQALMQQEYQRVHVALLGAKDQAQINSLLAKMQQQNWVISYDAYIADKVKDWEKKAQAERKGRKVGPTEE